MDKKDYKRVLNNINPDDNFEERLREKMQVRNKRVNIKSAAVAAACLVFVMGVGLFRNQFLNSTSDSKQTPVTDSTNQVVSHKPVTIPKIELPKNTDVMAKMMPLIVYKGKVYVMSESQISPQIGKTLLGEKIGRTKGNLNEWSTQDEYAKELASTVGEVDVYTAKNYDDSFRIMTYEEYDGQGAVNYFECLNGIEIRNGKDIFSKLNIDENLQDVKWESFDSWNNGKQEIKSIQSDEIFNNFLEGLNNAEPLEPEKAPETIYDEHTQKFLLLNLKDGSILRLRLFNNGYVLYNNLQVFFKVEAAAFNSMWDTMN